MKEFIPLRVQFRQYLKVILPSSLFNSISFLWQKTGANFYDVQGIVDSYTKKFLSTYPKIVQGGPFKSLVYVDKAVGSNYLHKLIGSYEAVLHPVLDEIFQKSYSTIIDIGAAEGYYLVGLGQKFPKAKLVGFETESTGRDLISQMYQKNNLQNELVLEGTATVSNVAPYITPSTLLICDCEGGELDILDPTIESAFATVETAIIELHDFIRPGIKEALLERFGSTHAIEIIQFKKAEPAHFPFLANIENKKDSYELRRERGWQEQEWLILRRK